MVNLVYDLAQVIDLYMTFTIWATHGLLISSQEKLMATMLVTRSKKELEHREKRIDDAPIGSKLNSASECWWGRGFVVN